MTCAAPIIVDSFAGGGGAEDTRGGGSMTIIIRVPAVPVAQPRPRATTRAGHASVYAHSAGHAVAAFKATVRHAAREAYAGPPLTGPLSVDVVAVFPRTKGQTWKRRAMPRIRHAKKPDCDNLLKSICDALNELAWADDAQVCECWIEKWIAAGDEQPGVVITVREAGDD